MRGIHISILLLALACSPALAQPAPGPTEASCRSFVQGFYNWHVTHGTNFEKTLKLKRSLLSAELGSALAADLAASSKHPDEIVGLDFDPFVNAQDPSPRYRVGQTALKEGSCFAQVYGVPSEDKNAKPDVTAELRLEKGAWKFVNFHYGSGNGPENENLLAILRRLKNDRSKGK